MKILNGKETAAKVRSRIKEEVDGLKSEGKRIPRLDVILVGEDPASQTYVRSKKRASEEVGFLNETIVLPAETTQEELEALVARENANPDVDGILVQFPLPSHLDETRIIEAIDPSKDVDGLHPVNAGKLVSGMEGMVPCTPKGCMVLLEEAGYDDLSGLKAAVIGRSRLVGKPAALLLQQKNATVTGIHSRTPNPAEIVREADIVVAAIGKPEYIDESWIKPGAVVIDVGINRTDDGLKGDVDFESVAPVASWITPVPGGVGPMTVAMLMDNTLEAYRRREAARG